MENQQECLPNLIIIGGSKSGSTSLHYYLGLHPEVFTTKEKELNFFSKADRWDKGVNWYRSKFDEHFKIRCEASPSYSHYQKYPHTAERMHTLIPGTKIIYILRSPFQKIVSHYQQKQIKLVEEFPISEAIQKNPVYLEKTNYYRQLKQYLAFFPMEQILVITTEELRDHRQETLNTIFKFLNIAAIADARFDLQKHKTINKRQLTPTGIKIKTLTKIVRPFHSGLSFWLGRIFTYPFSKPLPPKPILSEVSKSYIRQQLGRDMEELKKITKRDFSNWSI